MLAVFHVHHNPVIESNTVYFMQLYTARAMSLFIS